MHTPVSFDCGSSTRLYSRSLLVLLVLEQTTYAANEIFLDRLAQLLRITRYSRFMSDEAGFGQQQRWPGLQKPDLTVGQILGRTGSACCIAQQ